jgi:hypothetical protein
VAIKCPKCHLKNPETQKFCGDCGTPLPQRASHDGSQGIPEHVPDAGVMIGTPEHMSPEQIEAEDAKKRLAGLGSLP